MFHTHILQNLQLLLHLEHLPVWTKHISVLGSHMWLVAMVLASTALYQRDGDITHSEKTLKCQVQMGEEPQKRGESRKHLDRVVKKPFGGCLGGSIG